MFCSGCKLFAESFLKGLEKTSGSNYGQEKADWEPRFTNEKLGNFAASETRLVEILDGISRRRELNDFDVTIDKNDRFD